MGGDLAWWIVPAVLGAACAPAVDRLGRWALTTGTVAPLPGADPLGRAPHAGATPSPVSRWSTWAATSTAACVVACALAGVSVTLAVAERLPWAALPAWWALALIGVAITRTDLDRHRIPDVLVALLLASGGAGLLAAAWLGGTMASYARAWAAAGACLGAFLALALVSPSGLGMGDVKLMGALGLYLGYIGWGTLLLGIVLGLALAGLAGGVAAVTLSLRGSGRDGPESPPSARRRAVTALRTPIPLGPFLVTGAIAAMLVPAAI